jgi:hypothetical protein
MASFSNSEALRFDGADGGGAGAVLVVLDWHQAGLPHSHSPSTEVTMK